MSSSISEPFFPIISAKIFFKPIWYHCPDGFVGSSSIKSSYRTYKYTSKCNSFSFDHLKAGLPFVHNLLIQVCLKWFYIRIPFAFSFIGWNIFQHLLNYSKVFWKYRVLWQITNTNSICSCNGSAFRFFFSCNNFKQSGFASAIYTD